ncbi:GumC family protein [Tunturiibacter gelidoferens]|uniref:non-specific protein-tyrosine kinase n=1 Tax=Tunturiibacter gelidiferens TaxID=3069689 RepID=A0A9X0QHN2_9BACT|nr:polysaccharide biosynthesis tyrosine autokinase [Edaphobacter lichenicola]MBB5330632.1 capsular exopolysaccharide synthesis family protein [Edaphobacter lichenicola]
MGSKNTQPPLVGVPETNQAGFSTTVTDTTLSEALIVLRKRKLILIVAALLGLAYGIFKAESQPKLYESYGRIQVRSGSANEYRVNAQSYGGDSSSKLLSEIEILKSDSLMLTVCRELDLANNADFLEEKGPIEHANLDDGETRQDTVHRIQSNLHVSIVPKTDIISISYRSLNPKLSADIVNKVISDYMQHTYQTRFESSQRASVWLSGTLEGLKQEVEASQEQMMDMQRRLGILGFDPNHNQISASLDDLARAAGAAKLARIIAEARYRVVSGMDPNTIEGTIELTPGTAPGELNLLRGQLAGAKASYATLESSLGPNHPQAKAVKAQIDEYIKEIDEEQNRLITQAKQNYVIAKANEDQTTAALEAQKTDAYKLRDQLVEYTLRQREYEANRTLYDGLQQRLRTASVQSGLESLEVDVVDQALPPAEPQLRPQSTVILTALVFGLLAGIVAAFLMESLDTGLRSIAEIESITELPSLAIIPRARKSSVDQAATLSTAQRNVGILTQPKSQFAEAFRSLRTSLLLSNTGHPPKYIVLTSATPSEGKTTAASNLAAILAQRDTRVLLIDGDLRRPNIHHRFGLNGKIGLTTVLTGATKLEETVQRVPEIPNLDILPSGPVPPFPTEMLSSEAMETILKRCGDLYDYIVIDSPPILSVTDGVILARQADAVVLVVRHGKSSKHVVRRARDLLLRSGAAITGIVLNAVDLNSPEYYGYYGYSGYSYSSVDSDSWESQAVAHGDHTNVGETKR